MSIADFNLDLPFPGVFPKAWDFEIGKRDYMMFRNLEHFKNEVSKLTQRDDDKCDISYKKALSMLLRRETDFPEAEQANIRNLVRSNLHKRGLLTEEVYENFRYTTDGTQVGVDVGKYANGEPDCVITPSVQYIDFFYELYISVSYPYDVTNKSVRANVAKLLATVEELERQHIFIKVVLILPIIKASYTGKENYFASIPLFSHKETKSVATMSSVVNDRLLRKFFFAVLEETYGKNLRGGYGHPIELESAMNIGNEFNEIEFFENIVKTVGA